MLRLRHVFTTTGATLAGGGLGLLFTLLAARLLAPSENGHYAQFVLIFNLYYILLNFGLGPASTYFISSGQVREQRVVSVNVKAVGAIGLASTACVAALWLGDGGQWVEAHFKIPPVMLFAGIATGFFLLVFNQALAILVGKKSFDTVNLLNVLKTALPFPVVGLVLLVMAGETGFAVTTLISLIAASLLGVKLVARNLSHAPLARLAADAGLTRSIFRYGLLAYAANVMHYIAMRGLLIILSYHYAPEYVGFFSIALVLLETLLVIPGVIGQLIFPHSSNPEFDYGLTDTIMRLNVYVGLLTVVGVLWLAPWGIGWILGAKYEPVATALMHLTPSIVLLAVPRILSSVLSGRGHPEYPLFAAVISLVGGGFLALWSVPAHGPAGAAWVTNFVSGVTAGVTVFGYARVRGVGFVDVFSPRWADFELVGRAFQRLVHRG